MTRIEVLIETFRVIERNCKKMNYVNPFIPTIYKTNTFMFQLKTIDNVYYEWLFKII